MLNNEIKTLKLWFIFKEPFEICLIIRQKGTLFLQDSWNFLAIISRKKWIWSERSKISPISHLHFSKMILRCMKTVLAAIFKVGHIWKRSQRKKSKHYRQQPRWKLPRNLESFSRLLRSNGRCFERKRSKGVFLFFIMNPLNCVLLLSIVNIYRTFTVLIKNYEINNFKNLIRAERSNSEFSAKKGTLYANFWSKKPPMANICPYF